MVKARDLLKGVEYGIAFAIANPILALVILIVGYFFSAMILTTATSLAIDPVLWGFCLIVVALFKPNYKSILPWMWAGIIGVLYWLYKIVAIIQQAQEKIWCKIPLIGGILCNLYTGGIITYNLILLIAYIGVPFLMIYGLSFIYEQVIRRW
ncbi:MAG: hypothetical protein ACE5J4_02370 [Candidatus Aenigmatarchaeota archaeon]